MKPRLRLLLGILVSALALAVVLYSVDLRALRPALQRTPPLALLMAGAAFLLAMLARAWAWQALLGPRVSFSLAFWALQMSFFLNNFVPLRLGEVARAWVVHREAGVSWPRALSSVALARLTDAILLALVVLTAWPTGFMVPAAWRGRALALVLGGSLLLATLAWLARRRLSSRWAWLAEIVAIARGPALARFLVGKLLTWALLVGYYRALLVVWAPAVSWPTSAWAMAAATLGIALPSAPGYVGVYEAAAVGVLTWLRLSPADALAFALVQHALYLLLTTALGLLAWARLGWSRARWRAELRTAQAHLAASERRTP